MYPADISRLRDNSRGYQVRGGDPPVDVLLDAKTFVEFRCGLGKDSYLADLREERGCEGGCEPGRWSAPVVTPQQPSKPRTPRSHALVEHRDSADGDRAAGYAQFPQCEAVGQEEVVVIEEDEIPATACSDALIARRRRPGREISPDDSNPRIGITRLGWGGARVIDDQQFEVRNRLRDYGCDRFCQELRPVVSRDDHAEHGRVVASTFAHVRSFSRVANEDATPQQRPGDCSEWPNPGCRVGCS